MKITKILDEDMKATIDKIKDQLECYEQNLARIIKQRLEDYEFGKPSSNLAVSQAMNVFKNDPVRRQMVRHLAEIEMLCSSVRIEFDKEQ